MKVRIKKSGKPGDQLDYSLVTGPMYGHINDDAYESPETTVGHTLKAVPRNQANIEAEKGEIVLQPSERTAMMELFKVGGEKHYDGGTPLNVQDGAFLFSDTKKLKIKDPEVLKYFDKKFRKEGFTPAQIAKKYDLNAYNAILEDPKVSRLEKETAQRMIAANTQKLSELALIQESMKGMPNGVPSFVESVMGEPAQAQYGGMIKTDKSLPKYQNAGETYPKTDIRGWGAVGRGLYNTHEALVDAYKFVGKETYDAANMWLNPISPLRIKIGLAQKAAGDFLGEGFYNLFLNPSTVESFPKSEEITTSPTLKPVEGRTERKESSLEQTDIKTDTVYAPVKFKARPKMKNGGDLPQYQTQGERKVKTVQIDPESKVQMITYTDGSIEYKDSSGRKLNEYGEPIVNNSGSLNNNPAVSEYYQYNPLFKSEIDKQDELGNVIHTKQRFDQPFGVQPQRGGVYGFQDYDWNDFAARHGDWIETEYGDYGGIEGFLKDVQDPSKSKDATLWFQKKINDFSRSEFNKDYFAPSNTSPYGADGEFGAVTFSVPRFFRLNQNDPNYKEPAAQVAPPAAETVAPKQETKIPQAVPFTGTLRPRDNRWYLQDSLNLANTLADRVNTYMPTRQQVDFAAPDATYLDPSRQVAAIQEQAARYQDLAMNTADGQIARANTLGSSGQSAAQVADVLANYENQNVQIANQNAAQRVDVENRERLTNTELDSRYNQELATVNQNRDNALREIRQRRLNAFNQGTTNNQRKRMLEQVLYPQVSVDSVTGDWFTTNGRNLQDVIQTYSNPALGGTGMNPLKQAADMGAQMVAYKKQLMSQGLTEDDAKWVLSNMSRNMRANENTADMMFRNFMSNTNPF